MLPKLTVQYMIDSPWLKWTGDDYGLWILWNTLKKTLETVSWSVQSLKNNSRDWGLLQGPWGQFSFKIQLWMEAALEFECKAFASRREKAVQIFLGPPETKAVPGESSRRRTFSARTRTNTDSNTTNSLKPPVWWLYLLNSQLLKRSLYWLKESLFICVLKKQWRRTAVIENPFVLILSPVPLTSQILSIVVHSCLVPVQFTSVFEQSRLTDGSKYPGEIKAHRPVTL